MDPDLVRQQEEAERESLQGFQHAPLVPPVPPFRSAATTAVVEELRSSLGVEAVRVSERPESLRSAPSIAPSLVTVLGRFFQAAIAGAILGGGMGILAVWMLGLAPETAQIAIFTSALILALACGGISLKGTAA